jgi:muramoyltetrapeptide carboxypeptidase
MVRAGADACKPMTRVPRYLKPGDTIGLVCPAGHMPLTRMRTCIRVLEAEWGFRVRRGRTLGAGEAYFSGTDAERLADLQAMLDDDGVRAVLCARGGYGVGRIVDDIDFRRFDRRPKWVVGFSDITVLHLHIRARYGVATLHAPMAAAFNAGGWRGPHVGSLYEALTGARSDYGCAAHPFDRPGTAEGPLLGGNLALLAHLVGTPSFPDTEGCILFLEDVGETLYNIDRMMRQLLRSGKLDRLAGLIVGGFTDCRDTERPFGQDAYQIVRDVVAPFGYPVGYGFPVGHARENVALKSGCVHRLTVGSGTELREARRDKHR